MTRLLNTLRTGQVKDMLDATEDVLLVDLEAGVTTEAGEYYLASVARLDAERIQHVRITSMRIRHTKSTSGRTHVLTATNGPRTERVQIRYKTTPAYDDQVQGDLVRKLWTEVDDGFDFTGPIGIVPGGVEIDPSLDKDERESGKPSPRAIAEAVYAALGNPQTVTPDQLISAIMVTVRKEREHA